MNHEAFSLLVWCWHDEQTDTTQLRIVNVDTAEEVLLKEGCFLLRLFKDESASVERCLIRHLASGREAYIQGSLHLRSFMKDCLLGSPEPNTSDPDLPET